MKQLVLLATVSLLLAGCSSPELNLDVTIQDGFVIVVNKDPRVVHDCFIVANTKYFIRDRDLPASGQTSFSAFSMTDEQGNRLNPIVTKILNIDFRCKEGNKYLGIQY